MLTVAEALTIITTRVQPFAPVENPLADSLGLTLSENVVSQQDSPPFDKALMDGYAIRAEDLDDQAVTALLVVDEITAGRVGTKPVAAGQAIRIMTGAPIPDGADCVIQVELTQFNASTGNVEIEGAPVKCGSAILKQAASIKVGDCVVPQGRLLRAQELGALAELGCHNVSVRPAPRIGVLATGDELVPIDQTPAAGQIRNSNETMLAAQIRQAGGIPVPLGIAADNRDDLGERIAEGLQCDMLLLSGGVSAGKLDLVPSELEAAGVEQIFHKVNVKPGKPVWFGARNGASDGTSDSGAADTVWVFGLPGNPVSSMVCFELFVRTAIRRLMGMASAEPKMHKATLKQGHIARGDRPTYHLSRTESTSTGFQTTTVPWQGSADLRATVNADSLTLFPPGNKDWKPGEVVDVLQWSHD